MNKYKLAFLRFLTHGEISDQMLENSTNWRFEGDKFKFDTKVKVDPSKWRFVSGSGQ